LHYSNESLPKGKLVQGVFPEDATVKIPIKPKKETPPEANGHAPVENGTNIAGATNGVVTATSAKRAHPDDGEEPPLSKKAKTSGPVSVDGVISLDDDDDDVVAVVENGATDAAATMTSSNGSGGSGGAIVIDDD